MNDNIKVIKSKPSVWDAILRKEELKKELRLVNGIYVEVLVPVKKPYVKHPK